MESLHGFSGGAQAVAGRSTLNSVAIVQQPTKGSRRMCIQSFEQGRKRDHAQYER
jgi:hypothetical protein